MRVQDARGNWFRMPGVHNLGGGNDEASLRLRAWYEFAQYDEAVSSRLGALVPRVMLWVIGGMFLLAGVVFLGTPLPAMGVVMVVVGLGTVASSAFVPQMQEAAHRRALRNLDRCMGFCPACDYDLRGLEPEPDGCIVCPECGGAWLRNEAPRFSFGRSARSAGRQEPAEPA